jgi:hypothetical protein
MEYKKCFLQILKNNYPDTFKVMLSQIDSTYKTISEDIKFAATSSNPMDKRLDFSAYFLSLIQVLENQGESFEQIRTICLQVAYEYVRPKNKLQKWLKQLPAKLANTKLATLFLKRMDKKISVKGHANGFLAKVITDKAETYGLGYGIDIVECGICKLFKKHNAQKYASILCEVDKLTSSLAKLVLIQTGTIANGADKCDFRFKKH